MNHGLTRVFLQVSFHTPFNSVTLQLRKVQQLHILSRILSGIISHFLQQCLKGEISESLV